MKYHPFAIWMLAIVLGIFLQTYFDFSQRVLLIGCLLLLFIMIIQRVVARENVLFSVLGFLFFMGFGAWRFMQQNDFLEQLPSLSNEKELVQFKVQKILKPSAKFLKYSAQPIQAENDALLQQKVLVYVKKYQPQLHVSDKFWTYGKIQVIPGTKNPHQFDYKAYMLKRQTALQLFCDTLTQVTHPQKHSISHTFSAFKIEIKKRLDERGFSQDAKIFISSLALGDRNDLDKNWQEKLSSAGVMHLFSISGLHVGIVFGLFMLIFYPILYLPHGKAIRIITSLVFIWIFAWFVGFTPSVTRAAFMISFYYFTMLLQRSTNIFHTLAFTAFVLLLIYPNDLYDVGFQLSYSAVFFIAWLYTDFRKLFPHYRKPWKNYPFDLLSVTTTAQLGVMPISVYYFNQFSALFLLGNLVLLPFATIMVVISFIIVLMLSINFVPNFLVQSVNLTFGWVFQYLDRITEFESLIFRNISWNVFQVFILIGILIFTKYILKKFKWYKLIPIFALFLAFQCTRIYDELNFKNKTELIVFQEYKGSVIGLRNADEMDVFWQVEDSVKTMNYTLQPYILDEKITQVNYHALFENAKKSYFEKRGNMIKFNDATFYISNDKRDSLPKTDYVILRKGKFAYQPQFSSQTKRVIADGSNYPSVIQRLKQHSDKIFSTAENGAFMFTTDSTTHLVSNNP